MAELEPHELEAVESLVALEERRAAIAADPNRTMHACTLGWPEVPSDAMDNLCGRLGLFAEELTEDLAKVMCLDCLRAIAEWGQHQGQAACGLAFDYGDDTEAMLTRIHQLARVDLVGIHGEGGRLDMKLKANPVLLMEMAEVLAAALEGEGAANYASWSVTHPARGTFELIAQRKAGLRPAEVAAKERERAEAAEQAACGLAFDLGQLYERAAEAVTEFEDFTGHATGYDATRHALHRLGRALSAMSEGNYRQRDPLWWRLVYLDSLEHAGFRTGADDQVRKLLPGQPAWERASGPTLAEEVERLRYERDELRDWLDAAELRADRAEALAAGYEKALEVERRNRP
jgi:hypothetical protein